MEFKSRLFASYLREKGGESASLPHATYLRPEKIFVIYLEEDRDAEIHERLGEVDHALTRVVDRHRADGEISLLQRDREREKEERDKIPSEKNARTKETADVVSGIEISAPSLLRKLARHTHSFSCPLLPPVPPRHIINCSFSVCERGSGAPRGDTMQQFAGGFISGLRCTRISAANVSAVSSPAREENLFCPFFAYTLVPFSYM